jgi:hypothetical protein
MGKVLLGNVKGPQGPQGPQGDTYKLTDEDRVAIATLIKNSLVTEEWTFELSDGSTVVKAVAVG